MSHHQKRGGEAPKHLFDADFISNVWGHCKLTTCVCADVTETGGASMHEGVVRLQGNLKRVEL